MLGRVGFASKNILTALFLFVSTGRGVSTSEALELVFQDVGDVCPTIQCYGVCTSTTSATPYRLGMSTSRPSSFKWHGFDKYRWTSIVVSLKIFLIFAAFSRTWCTCAPQNSQPLSVPPPRRLGSTRSCPKTHTHGPHMMWGRKGFSAAKTTTPQVNEKSRPRPQER